MLIASPARGCGSRQVARSVRWIRIPALIQIKVFQQFSPLFDCVVLLRTRYTGPIEEQFWENRTPCKAKNCTCLSLWSWNTIYLNIMDDVRNKVVHAHSFWMHVHRVSVWSELRGSRIPAQLPLAAFGRLHATPARQFMNVRPLHAFRSARRESRMEALSLLSVAVHTFHSVA